MQQHFTVVIIQQNGVQICGDWGWLHSFVKLEYLAMAEG
jgi:hypothetical protein